jgi:hypothetical protein
MREITSHKVNPVNDKLKITILDEPGAGVTAKREAEPKGKQLLKKLADQYETGDASLKASRGFYLRKLYAGFVNAEDRG